MAIKWNLKWRGWTASLPVKAACLLLIPAMVVAWGWNVYSRVIQKDLDLRILFADAITYSPIYTEEYFTAVSYGERVLKLGGEEAIVSRPMVWGVTDDGVYLYDRDTGDILEHVDEDEYRLLSRSEDPAKTRQNVTGDPETDQYLADRKAAFISRKLEDFQEAVRWLEAQPALYYYIDTGTETVANTAWDLEFYRSQPAYLTIHDSILQTSLEPGRTYDLPTGYIRLGGMSYRGFHGEYEGKILLLAFDNQYFIQQTGPWINDVQRTLTQFGVYTAIEVGLGLLCFIILMAGAGRRRSDGGREIHYTLWDRIYLDVGLVLLIGYVACIGGIMSELSYYIDFSQLQVNRFVQVFIATVIFLIILPALGYCMSLAKRTKDRSCIKHTLIYTACHSFYRWCGSLWAGLHLTVKTSLVVATLFLTILLCIALPPLVVPVIVGALVVLLRQARRLHLISVGTALACEGIYDPPIPVKGGELGAIAENINHISNGINQAVAQQMKSERLKTELITNVSHDIRTPLTSLITYTDLLQKEGLDSEKAEEYLEILIQKSQRLKHLTDALFEASKAATGNVEVRLEPLDLADLVRQCLGELDEKVRESGLDFRVTLPDQAMVLADGKLMWRVVENLLTNVFKYALANSRVYLSVEREPEGYRLELKNISAAALNVDPMELTERFKQGDEARAGEGSGLGLSIVQSFVQLQKGQFELSIDGDLFKAVVKLPLA